MPNIWQQRSAPVHDTFLHSILMVCLSLVKSFEKIDYTVVAVGEFAKFVTPWELKLKLNKLA